MIIGRREICPALREWMARAGPAGEVAVATVGKIKTIVQMVALGFLLYRELLLGPPIFQIGEWLVAADPGPWWWIHTRAAWPALRAQENAVANMRVLPPGNEPVKWAGSTRESSVVEHDLAVGVRGSNPFSRSSLRSPARGASFFQ